jgi:hypothetical protein
MVSKLEYEDKYDKVGKLIWCMEDLSSSI